MKNAKRIISLFLAVLMVLSSLAVTTTVSVAAAEDHGTQPTTWWSDNAATGFGGGNGSSSNPWLITTPAELAYFANYVEGGALNSATATVYFKITKALDMSAHQWKPIGYSSADIQTNTFRMAELDGGNNLISGLKLTASAAISGYQYAYGCAMFARISTGATVKNMNLAVKILNPVLTSGTTGAATVVAGLVGTAYANAKVASANVAIDLDVNGTGAKYYYAGAIGRLYGAKINDAATSTSYPSAEGITVTGDINVVPPSSEVFVAGVVGDYQGSSIKNIVNEATITVTSSVSAAVGVGGILATTSSGPTGSGLVNKGAINVTLNGTTGAASNIGGVIGKPAVLRNHMGACKNEGDITVTTAGASIAVGGVVGRAEHKECNFVGFSNSGNIKVTKTNASSNAIVGGIIGYLAGAAAGPKMVNAENTGTITFEVKDGVACAPWVGGLVGVAKHLAISNSVNRGAINVTGVAYTFYLGGILGQQQNGESSSITNTANYGAVSLVDFGTYSAREDRYIGGIVGHIAGPTGVVVSKCVNYGTLHFESVEQGSIGGIVGYLGVDGTIISECTNEGIVEVYNVNNTSHRSLGGIVGQLYKGTIDGCVNNGLVHQAEVVQNANATGGLTGCALNASIVKNSENNGEVRLTCKTGVTNTNELYVGGLIARMDNTAQAIDLTNAGPVNVKVLRGISDGSYIAGGIGRAATSAKVTRVTNEGRVYVTNQDATVTNARLYIGGVANLIGSTVGDTLINKGEVIFDGNKGATLCVGGVLGRAANTSTLINSTNYANVTVNKTGSGGDNQVAGVVGHTLGSCTLQNLTNNGDVTVNAYGGCYVGGIFGVVYATASANTITDCFNSGALRSTSLSSSNNATAGISSRTSAADPAVHGAWVKFENCVNVGFVAKGGLSGNIIGYTQASGQSEIVDANDLNGNGNTTEKIKVIASSYSVSLVNCIGYGSDVKYGLVGSHRTDNLVIENCFGNCEYPISYYNQNLNVLYSNGSGKEVVSVNGKDVSGNQVDYKCAEYAFVRLETLEKARVRLDSLGTEESGIRFDSLIDKQTVDALKAATGVTYTFGTLIAPTQNLNHAAVATQYDKMAAMDAMGGKRYTLVPYAQDFLSVDGNDCFFAGALNNIKEKNFNLSFTAIAYLTVTVGDFTFTFYADYDDANTERARSIAQIAGMAFEDRATEEIVLDGFNYKYPAFERNECYLGNWSVYSNSQLDLLRAWSAYDNTGKQVPDGLSVNGVSIRDYKIVYAQSPIYKTYGSVSGKTLFGDLGDVKFDIVNFSTPTGETVSFGDALLGERYDYDYQTALRLQKLIADKYGVTLEVVPDYDIGANSAITSDDIVTPEGKYEILVGSTNRAKSQSVAIARMSVDQFTLKIEDTSIVVCGGSFGTTWHAVDALEALFATLDSEASYNLKMAGDLSGSYKMQKIATIGDSITRGSQALPDSSSYVKDYGLKGGAYTTFGSNATETYYRYYLSYPANLQRLIWKEAVVYNYGLGGSTVASYYTQNSSWWQDCYNTSNTADVDFDLVFMQHGTNDSGGNGGAYNWSAATKRTFRDGVQGMMDDILKGSPNAKFVFNNIPHRFDSTSVIEPGHGTETKNNLTGGTNEANTMAMADIQRDMVAGFARTGVYKVYLFNMNKYMRDHLVVEGVHCDCQGYNDPADRTSARPTANFDSTGEMAAHSYYFNFNSPYGYSEGTHPNFRGYNKMADGAYSMVQYVLFGGEKPTYMIDVQ